MVFRVRPRLLNNPLSQAKARRYSLPDAEGMGVGSWGLSATNTFSPSHHAP